MFRLLVMPDASAAVVQYLLACMLVWAVMPSTGLGADLQQLMSDGRVPGLSMAVIRKGEVVEVTSAGVRSSSTGTLVDAYTIFDAASLTKPVFAYAALQLVDAGALSLDAPLSKYVPNYVLKDPRAADVTVRQVLSHTTGLPNWRSEKWPLKTHFAPGERFSYSGEAFVWLQRVVEAITGEPLDAVVQRLVFDPLEMRDSSFVWLAAFDADYADPHDAVPSPSAKRKWSTANAAASLQTTAADYARFLQAVLLGQRLKPATARLWLEPQVTLRHNCYRCLDPDLPEVDTRVAWGLGWGLEPDAGTFFHWGDNKGSKAFVIGSVRERSAVVVFTNGANGMSIMPELIARAMPGDRPAFDWLAYPRYTPSGR